MKLCNVTDIDAMYFYEVSFGKINRLVHKEWPVFSVMFIVTCTSFSSVSLYLYIVYFLYLPSSTCIFVLVFFVFVFCFCGE